MSRPVPIFRGKDHTHPRPSRCKLLADFATSYWLKDALLAAWRRDPVDALRDAKTLVLCLEDRLAGVSR